MPPAAIGTTPRTPHTRLTSTRTLAPWHSPRATSSSCRVVQGRRRRLLHLFFLQRLDRVRRPGHCGIRAFRLGAEERCVLAAAYIAVECVFRNSASAAAVPDEQISNLSGTVTTSSFPSLPFRTQVTAVWQI